MPYMHRRVQSAPGGAPISAKIPLAKNGSISKPLNLFPYLILTQLACFLLQFINDVSFIDPDRQLHSILTVNISNQRRGKHVKA